MTACIIHQTSDLSAAGSADKSFLAWQVMQDETVGMWGGQPANPVR